MRNRTLEDDSYDLEFVNIKLINCVCQSLRTVDLKEVLTQDVISFMEKLQHLMLATGAAQSTVLCNTAKRTRMLSKSEFINYLLYGL